MRYFTPFFHSMSSDSCILHVQLIFFGPATVQMLCDHRSLWLVASVLDGVAETQYLLPCPCTFCVVMGAGGAGSEASIRTQRRAEWSLCG